MGLMIPRGIVYHSVLDDISALLRSTYTSLDDLASIEIFEAKFASYVGCNYCVSFPFARTAIYSALKLRAFKAGDEVIMPPITIKAILDVILDLKLKPVFVDIDPDTLCFELEKLELAITPDTKAILITYLFGMVPAIDSMMAICRENNLYVIEDFSQCLNGKYRNKKVGSFGDVGVYSASSIKTLDTYGGGLLVCNDETTATRLREYQKALKPAGRIQLMRKIIVDLIRNVATTRYIFHLFVSPLIKLISYLNPESVLKHTGGRKKEMISELPQDWFTSYTSFQANEGLRIIEEIEQNDQVRKDNVNQIKSSTSAIAFPLGVNNAENVYWQLVAYFNEPAKVQKYLRSKKVDTSITSLEYISNLPAYPVKGDTPNASKLCSNGLFIPAYPGLSKSDISHISRVLNELQSI